MRLLTKIKLINWHFFTNETVVIDRSTLITGDNGAGKSTLIDALQVAIVANLKKVRFNSSALEERTTRDLRSYLRGKTGTEGRSQYLRNEDFSSYIVLEITCTTDKQPYLIGVVFDYYHTTGEVEHVFFRIDREPLRDELFFKETRFPRNRHEFFDYLKARGYKFKQYRNDLSGYIYDLRQLFGGVKESFFSLFVKGISFSPITDLRRFVYSYILEEREIDVTSMREYFEKFHQVELLIEETKREIAALEQIEGQYAEVEKLRRNLTVSDFMVLRGRWEVKLVESGKLAAARDRVAEDIGRLAAEITAAEAEGRALNETLERLEQAIRENEASVREQALKGKIEELRARLAELSQLRRNLVAQFKAEAGESETLHTIMAAAEAPPGLTSPLLESKEAWLAAAAALDTAAPPLPQEDAAREAAAGSASFPQDWSGLARGWKDCRDWLLIQRDGWSREAKAAEDEADRLRREIEGLEKNRVLSADAPAMKLKAILEEHLLSDDGRKVPVHLFCEVIELKNERWRNAVEGYLHTQKFDLLVPPEHFDQALALYERHKFTHGIERVGVVNTGRLLSERRPPRPGSLAEEITAAVDYAAAYADWLLGGLIKCDTEQELKLHARAVTDTCMLYQNHTARQIPRSRYELPFIGREAVKFQLTRKREELSAVEEKLKSLQRKLREAAPAEKLAADKADRYAGWQREAEKLAAAAELEEELAARQKELLSLDFSELKRLQEEKKQAQSRKEELERRSNELATQKGEMNAQHKQLQQQLDDSERQAAALREEYEAFLASLDGELQAHCLKKWESEAAGRPAETLLNNYRGSREGLNTRLIKQREALVKIRTDFIHSFHFSGDPAAEDNEAFRRRHRLLAESHLQDYETRAREAREQAEQSFQEHFVSKMGEYIKSAQMEIKELNRALKEMRFGTDAYTFSLGAKSDKKRFYDMIMDTGVYQGSIFRPVFKEKHGEAIDELFREITRPGEDFTETMHELTDYRSYLDFEIVITDERGNRSHFSKVARDKSGGETQVPFYVAILASFYQAYQLYRKSDSLRLVVFDEAFNRMDADRIEEAITFMKNLGFQALIVAPTGRIQLIVPHVNTNLVVMKEGFHSFIERVTRKDLEKWSGDDGK